MVRATTRVCGRYRSHHLFCAGHQLHDGSSRRSARPRIRVHPAKPGVAGNTNNRVVPLIMRAVTGFAQKVRRTDPLPPSLDASPYRARASRAALPLCEGENEPVHFTSPFSPSVRGSRERGGRSADFLCKALFLLIFGLAATSLAAEKPSLA